MRLRLFIAMFGLVLCTYATAEEENLSKLRDLFFGDALFSAYQDDYFSAISKLDVELGQYYSLDEPELDPFHLTINQAEFAVGDLEISYRMHQRAGRAIRSIMESHMSQPVRNEAAYRLAKIYFQKNDPVNALHILQRIEGDVPESIRSDEAFLRAQVYIATGKFGEAVEILRPLQNLEALEGYAAYNLGIALIQNGQEQEGLLQLDKMGQLKTNDPAVLALRDKANLTLGYRILESGSPQLAAQYLERVRLDGPFSNRALLAAGWVHVSLGDFERALVPWSLLHKRTQIDASVQEALLALPYAYGKLDIYGKSAVLYGHAMDVFGGEVLNLDSSIKRIREGKFLKAVLDEQGESDKNWIVNLRNLPDSPETHYILELMASHDFQEGLKNYLDLAEMRKVIARWMHDLDSFEEIIEIRRRYYTPLLPVIDKEFKTLDSRIKLRLEQRERISQRLKGMLVARRPDYLAYSYERAAQDSLARMQVYLESHRKFDTPETRERIRRLKGLVHWQINVDYDQRLTDTFEHLRELDDDIEKLNKLYRSFIRTRQAATQSYEGYDIPIRQLRSRLTQSEAKLNGIMARQGRMLEVMAINELDRRRKKLEDYQVKARFALAESYDRATKKQQQEELKAP